MKTKKEKEEIILSDTLNKKYEYGFVTKIDQETLPPGLNENVIKIISLWSVPVSLVAKSLQ